MEDQKLSEETTRHPFPNSESMDINEGQTTNGTIGGTGSGLDKLQNRGEDKTVNDNLQQEDKN